MENIYLTTKYTLYDCLEILSAAMPEIDNRREGNPMMATLTRISWWLDSIILLVGRKTNCSIGIIMFFGLLLGSKIQNKFFEILFKPTYFQMLCYCGIIVLSCYYSVAELKSAIAQRLCGVAVLSLVSYHMWAFIPMPSVSYLLCFLFSVLPVSYLLTLLPSIIFLLDVMLSSVGKNAKRMNHYLKWLEIKLLFDNYERFELWLKKSSGQADCLKVICYSVFAILLCCLGMLNHPSISGVVFLSSSGYLLWSFATPLPFWSRLCFVCVFDLLLAGLATAYEYRHDWMVYCRVWMERKRERKMKGE